MYLLEPASIEALPSYVFQSAPLLERDLRESLAIGKGTLANYGHTVRNCDLFYRTTAKA